jgi:hypothetical protein
MLNYRFDNFVWALLVGLFCLANASVSGAASIEKLLMPGDVIAGHAKYEAECTKCHDRSFTDKNQNKMCLDCHKEVRADFDKEKGFHGRSKGMKERECRSCHTDHKGRDYDVVGLEKTMFDHSVTNFKLEGKHADIQCARCHVRKDDKPLKYRDAKGKCYDCHKDDDAHNDNLGKKCGDCHSAVAWHKESSFDHDKTDFPLKEKHKKVSCASCHPNERYKDISKVCVDCHSINDVHRGTYGKKCQDCHTEKDWEKTKFNHDKDTKFLLKGKHKEVTCAACHGDDIYAELKKKCVACHKPDDFHRGRFGEKCEDCHKEKKWDEVKFDHDKDTDYKLLGRHAKANCLACHRTDIYAELDSECISCHKADDVHKGQEGKRCDTCHNETGWLKKLTFDHDITRFPLLGLHALASCEDCHVTKSFKAAKLECNSCHDKDDVHKKRLGTGCSLCHNQNDWKVWLFDHDKQTDFKLEGKHKKNHCYACHRLPVSGEIDLPTTCYQCHEEDDEHMGRFGNRCERCHTAESFDDIRLRVGL